MMVITVIGIVSTTVGETVMMTLEAEAVAQEVTTAAVVMEAEVEVEMVAEMAEGLVAVLVVEESLDSIVTIARQKALVEAVDAVETTNVNRVIITIADESARGAYETGFDILQTRNAAYD